MADSPPKIKKVSPSTAEFWLGVVIASITLIFSVPVIYILFGCIVIVLLGKVLGNSNTRKGHPTTAEFCLGLVVALFILVSPVLVMELLFICVFVVLLGKVLGDAESRSAQTADSKNTERTPAEIGLGAAIAFITLMFPVPVLSLLFACVTVILVGKVLAKNTGNQGGQVVQRA
ncbi:MAG: hypothetical protein ACHP79_04335 [Terriglobales bacterium]